MATTAIIILVVGVQYAMIGKVSLALSQMGYQGARYAAANESAGNTPVKTYMLSVGSSIFNNNASLLGVNVSPVSARTFGQKLTVVSTFTLPSSVLFLPNPFMGIVPFPTQLSTTIVQSSN